MSWKRLTLLCFGTLSLCFLVAQSSVVEIGQVSVHDHTDDVEGGTITVGTTETASNVGVGGVGIFDGKIGVDLQFKNVNAGSTKITITDDIGNNEIDVNTDLSVLWAFTGNIDLGDGVGDLVSVTGSIDTDLVFATPGTTRRITLVQAASDTNGDILQTQGAQGGNASATAGGTGGPNRVFGGVGGPGTASLVAGGGGAVTLQAGDAGVDNGGGGAPGSNLILNAGLGTGTFANGAILLGNVQTDSITLGNASANPTITQAGTGAVLFKGLLQVDGTLGVLETGASPIWRTTIQGGDQGANITWTLPAAQGAVDEVLTNNGSGVLSWAAAGGVNTFIIGATSAVGLGGVQWYFSIDGSLSDTSEAVVDRIRMPATCTVRNLYVEILTAPGAGASRTLTVRDDGVSTALTCTISNTALSCSDLINSAVIVAGSKINIFHDVTGSPANQSNFHWSFQCN